MDGTRDKDWNADRYGSAEIYHDGGCYGDTAYDVDSLGRQDYGVVDFCDNVGFSS